MPPFRRLAAALLLAAVPGAAMAQDSLPAAAPPAAAPPDTAAASWTRKPPTGPFGAFWRSALVPGWGQLTQKRTVPALLFVAAEVVTVSFAVRANADYREAVKGTPEYEDAVRRREDWFVLVGFNHLLSAAEAFVGAHLWDFPGDLALRPTAAGGTAAVVTLPMRLP